MLKFLNKNILSQYCEQSREKFEYDEDMHAISVLHILELIYNYFQLSECESVTVKFSNEIIKWETGKPHIVHGCTDIPREGDTNYIVTLYVKSIFYMNKSGCFKKELLRVALHEMRHVHDELFYGHSPEYRAKTYEKLTPHFLKIMDYFNEEL